MSYESWCKEFMSINFREVTKENENAWILQKWKGARKENLEKHEMTLKDDYIYDDADIIHYIFSASRCFWCRENDKNNPAYHLGEDCRYCPAVMVGMKVCTGHTSPYHDFYHGGDPGPMIEWIEKAIKLIEENRDKPTIRTQ